MTALVSFEPVGNMSRREACLEVFRAMKPGDWMGIEELLDKVEESTGETIPEQALRHAAWTAREELAKKSEVGVEAYKGGYKRLLADGQVAAAEKRLKRVRRGVRRTVRWAGAALANPEVVGPDRLRLERIRSVSVAQKELDERRAEKRRPLSLGE